MKGIHNYVSSFDVIRNANCKIELVDVVRCDDVHDLKQLERQFIENNDCVNIRVPSRSGNEYMRGYMREYRENHREDYNTKMREYMRNWGQELHVCECGSKVKTKSLKPHLKTKRHLQWETLDAQVV